jgi:hypothetical protein
MFNLFKKHSTEPEENALPGPAYLQGFTCPPADGKSIKHREWRAQVKAASGQTKFTIKYYGQLHKDHPTLIGRTGFAPALVYAVDNITGEQIMLFDGCKHGYDPMFADEFTSEQISNRPANNIYRDKHGNETFEVIVSVYYAVDYDEEFGGEVDEHGLMEIGDGSKLPFETIKRNGFSSIQVIAINNSGKKMDIVSEELS